MIRRKHRWFSQNGFTLIEILVVVAIIGILAAIGIFAYQTSLRRAKVGKAQADLDMLRKAVITLELDTQLHPKATQITDCFVAGTDNELELSNNAASGLVTHDNSGAYAYPGWDGPYIDKVPVDPWGNRYIFDNDHTCNPKATGCPSGSKTSVRAIYSKGPDGVGNAVISGNSSDDEDNVTVVLCQE